MSKFKEKRLFVLNDPYAPRLCPELAVEIGLNESLLFLQLEFWIAVRGEEHKGKVWIRKSVRDMQERFPFLSVATINRTVESLKKKKLIFTDTFNKSESDKTRWFAINLKQAAELKSVSLADSTKTDSSAPQAESEATTQNETALESSDATTQNETAPLLKMKQGTTQNETAPLLKMRQPTTQNDKSIRNIENIENSLETDLERGCRARAGPYPEGLLDDQGVRHYYDHVGKVPTIHAQESIHAKVKDLTLWCKAICYWLDDQREYWKVGKIIEVYQELEQNGGEFIKPYSSGKDNTGKPATAATASCGNTSGGRRFTPKRVIKGG